ncbi:TorF family putative porin [Desulforhopalus singaporensis]|uniref:Outer membrane protein beta-barrel domain-containing protein n=1 Tax=Desulforhopalus singaporensis TaxID=91360 RepID=A0A1H0V8A1_9BACT|nr:TorF family putative porin [Desulforhopalus singaporensis]SDP74621.1 conserved hypothetical protein [Desulforhopalus singaporensis]
MRRDLFAFLLAVTIVVSCSSTSLASEEASIFAAENFSSTLILTSDYVCEGVSYSDQDPAIQGTIDYYHPGTGIFVGLWGSSWDDGGVSNDIELGGWVGQAGALGPITYDVAAYYWIYPGAEDEGFEYDYFQAGINLSHTFEEAFLSPSLKVGYLWSPEYSGEEGTSHKFMSQLGLSLMYGFRMELEAGHYDIEGGNITGNGGGLDGGDGYDWEYYRVGLSRDLIAGFNVDLSYHINSEDEFFKEYYGGKDIADNRLVFTLSRTF